MAILVSRAIWFGDPVADIDEQLYSLIGNGLLHGELPYVDNWDRKPFGLFALYALAHAIGGPGPLAYQIMAALFTLGGAVLVYRLACVLVDWITATAAAVIYVALMSAYSCYSGQSEALFMPLMLGMVWLVLDPDHPKAFTRACWAMLIGGLALQIKYTIVTQCVALGLWVLWHEYRRGVAMPRLVAHAAIFGALGLLPTFIIALVYAALGHADAFVFANFVSFFDRVPAEQGRFTFFVLEKLPPILALVVPGIYYALRSNHPPNKPAYALYKLWFLSCAATAFLPSTVYWYYFAAMVPGAALISLPFIDRKGPFGPMAAPLLVAVSILLVSPIDRYTKAQEERREVETLAAAITPLLSAQNCLFIFDGPTSLYRMTGSCHPTRFIYPDHLNNALERHALGIVQEDEVARILTRRPPVIVTNDEPFTVQNMAAKALVDQSIARNYVPLSQALLNDRIIRAWRLRD